MHRIQIFLLISMVSWTVLQCKHAPLASDVENAQVLGNEGAVYVFIHDLSTSPPSVIVKQCEERALAVNNDCPQYPRNKTKYETRMSLSNLKFELAKHSQKYSKDLQKLSLTPAKFAELFIQDYVADVGTDVDLETVSSRESGSTQNQIFKKVIEDMMKGGLQAVLSKSYQVIHLAYSDSSQSRVSISYCDRTLGDYCEASKSVTTASAPIDGVKSALPAAFFSEFSQVLAKHGKIVTDGALYNEAIYATNPWVEPTSDQLQFMADLNTHLPKIIAVIYTSGFEIQVAKQVSVFDCKRIDRTDPKCLEKSDKPKVVTFESFQTSLYTMTMTCLKNRFSCYPGPYIEKTLEELKKKIAHDPKKFVTIRDVTDHASQQLKNSSAQGNHILIGRDRLVRFDADTSENKLNYFVAEIFFHLFNPDYMPPLLEPTINAK